MSGLRVTVADPLEEPVPDAWAAFVRDQRLSAAWSPDVLRALAWCGRHRQLMAVVGDSGGAPCALFAVRHVTPGGARGRRYAPPRRTRRPPGAPGYLECHLPPAITWPGHAFHPGLDDAGRAEALGAFERAVRRRTGAGTAGVLYRQVGTAELPAFTGRGRLVRRVLPEAYLENEWDDFEAYLRGLPRRDRKNLQRLRRLVDADPRVSTAVEERLDGAEASRLLHVVQLRHHGRGRPPDPFPAVYYDLLGGREGVRYFTYRAPAGSLLAYGLLIDDGTTLRCQGWGSRHAADGGRGNLYFDHFLRQIAYLIEQGRERLILGKTMTELKERYGARNAPLHAVVSLRAGR